MPAPIRRRRPAGPLPSTGDSLIDQALQHLAGQLRQPARAPAHSRAVHNYFRLLLADEPREVLAAMYLDATMSMLHSEIVFQGGPSSVLISPRVLIQRCLELNAMGLVIAHNHPSGHAGPSRADRTMTGKVAEACQLFEIRLVDSLVIGGGADLQVSSILHRNNQPEY